MHLRLFLVLLIGVLTTGWLMAEEPLRVVLLSGSEEYKSDESLTKFQAYLKNDHKIDSVLLKAPSVDRLPGLEALEKADVAVFFTRRLTIDGDSLDRVRRYCEAKKPIVGIRTASHGFQKWLEFDKLYLGGNYMGHYGNGPVQTVRIIPEASKHPVLRGVASPMTSTYSLYKTAPLAEGCQPLMLGETAESGGQQPVTWVRELMGQRIFYTSLGGPDDMEQPDLRRMIVNALFWTTRREPVK